MKFLILFNLVFLSFMTMASETTSPSELEMSPILANAEGSVKLLVPILNAKDPVEGVQTKIKGKLYQVIEGVPGMKIPNGAILQTLGESKAQVILQNGNSFVAGKATEMAMSWAKDVKGKMALDLNVKDGLVRGIVGNKDEFNVNLITNSFKASMKNAEFITGAIESGNVTGAAKNASKGAVLKMIHGDSKLKPLAKLANLNGGDAKEMIAQAGSDLVMGVKDLKAVPFLQSDILKQATSISSTVDKLKNASAKDLLGQLALSADSIADQVGQQAAPPPDNCGCPSLEERLKRAALNKARAKVAASIRSQDGKKSANQGEESQAKPQDEKGVLEGLDPITELSCMSPMLSQLKGAAQIIKSLKNGIFSSKEAKEGDCVSNNSLFKSLTDSRSALKFPNGDEIFSSDNTDMIMKWTKKKLDLKIDQGTIRGVFKNSPNRLVNMQAKGLKVSTRGGDLQLSAPKTSATSNSNSKSNSNPSSAASASSGLGSALGSLPNPAAAQLGAAAAAAAPVAGLASGLASGLMGSAISVFGGLASAGGQALSAGTQLAAGQKVPRKLSSEEISQLQSQTSPVSKPQSPSANSAQAPSAPVASAQAPANPVSTTPPAVNPPPATPSVQNPPISPSGTTPDTSAATGLAAAAGLASGSGAATTAATSVLGGAVGAVGAAAASVGGAVGAAAVPSVNPVADAASKVNPIQKLGSEAPIENPKVVDPKQVAPVESGLWKPGSEQPEEDFIKKYLNF